MSHAPVRPRQPGQQPGWCEGAPKVARSHEISRNRGQVEGWKALLRLCLSTMMVSPAFPFSSPFLFLFPLFA